MTKNEFIEKIANLFGRKGRANLTYDEENVLMIIYDETKQSGYDSGYDDGYDAGWIGGLNCGGEEY